MVTIREWLGSRWKKQSLREIGAELGVTGQSIRQWVHGFSRPSLAKCREIAAVMAREGLVADPVALYSEAVSFSALARERAQTPLDEPAKIEDTVTADNTPGSDTISVGRLRQEG